MVDADTKVRLLRQHCDSNDVQLWLRRHAQAKSLHALAQMYPHLEGENGVQERLNEIEMTLQAAVHEHEMGHVGAKVGAIADETDREREDNAGGVPIRSVPTGTLNGAGAGPAEPRSATTPPSRPAPAPSSSPSPSISPDRSRSSTSPPRTPPAASNGSSSPSAQATSRAAAHRKAHGGYDDAVVNFLTAAGEPRKQNDLCVELGVPRGSVTGIVDRLMREGRVVVRIAHGRKMITVPNAPPAPGDPPKPRDPQEEVVTREDMRGMIATARRDVEALFDRLERLL